MCSSETASDGFGEGYRAVVLYFVSMAEQRLTDEKYWDKVWAHGSVSSTRLSRWKRFLVEPPIVRQFWEEVLPRFLPSGPAHVVELGSAPGRNLIQWREQFGYNIFGVDFSPEGVREQRETFSRCGVDDSSSLQADFLEQSFQDQYRDKFDIVYSAGLIEHFTRPDEAVGAHIRILKPGGLLIVSIPNLAGLYRYLVPTRILDLHNLEIMHLAAFRALFEMQDVRPLFCEYLGRLDLGVTYTGETAFCRILLRMQVLANALMHIVPIPENRLTSPQLLFIGQKLESCQK
jgi:SAM-dependent methyltransferase